MKYDWKKNDKALYLPKAEPIRVQVPMCAYLKVSGQGDPNAEDFGRAVEMLYTASYTLKMLPKKHAAPPGYYEYAVFRSKRRGVWRREPPTGIKAPSSTMS